MSAKALLHEAIAAVKAGQRNYGRDLFLELVELDPREELAWIWLSGLMETREQQIKALENAIALDKHGKKLKVNQLHYLGQHETGSEHRKFRTAMKLVESGERDRGQAMLNEIISDHREHELAWMALSELANDPMKKASLLEQALRINPNNFKAREKLIALQHDLYQEHLRMGLLYQQQRKLAEAIEAYKAAERYASNGSFRAAARQRWELIESQQGNKAAVAPMAKNRWRLLRMVISLPLIYLVLIALQSRLDPLAISPIMCIGGLVAYAGSFMAIASGVSPLHPVWVNLFGKKGLMDSAKRASVRGAGIVLLILSFAVGLYFAVTSLMSTLN